MKKENVIKKIEEHVKKKFEYEYSGHDYWHVKRVVNLSAKIAKTEKCNEMKVYFTALLHDLFDEKIFDISDKRKQITEYFIESKMTDIFSEDDINSIINDLLNMSYRGSFESQMLSIEGKIVQDADRIDAIGAIGIARAFAYGGNKKHVIYNPNQNNEEKPSDYINNDLDEISHFYEKLLLIKDNLNTNEAKRIAFERDKFMQDYLNQFFYEWNEDING